MKEISHKTIKDLLQKEKERQLEGLELIASENYVSQDVLSAMGSILTNKYSEGYPGKRYYKGNEYIDEIEKEAIKRAKELFKTEHVNVQPYSGSPANLAVHLALLKPGDKTMGMSLDAGGHLTHGFKVSISGKYFDSVSYGVNDKGYIDYDEVLKIARDHKPKLIWSGFSAYSRIIDWKEFRKIADEVGAYLVADIAHVAGLVATDLYPSPVGIADIVTTTTHKTLRGPRGAMIMCKEEYASDIDKAVFPGLQGGPHNHTTAAIAVALKEASTKDFKEYSKQVVSNAKVLSEELIKKDYEIVSGGTDNHLFLVDLTLSKGLEEMGGEEASTVLEKANITLNKNAIPNDPRKPWDPSGLRIGTPALTTRGMKEEEMVKVAEYIDTVLKNKDDEEVIKQVREEVKEFTSKFPIPGINI
jgi:glycine hydroxymethyltransferase